MLAHACMRARAPPLAAASRPGPGSGSLPGLVLFESGLKGMGCSATRTRPAPIRSGSKPPARQRMSENRWAVGRFGPNSCDGSVRTAATVGNSRTRMPLPERYK